MADIRRILNYGWKSFTAANASGCDVLIRDNQLFFYCGNLMADSLKWYFYYKKKICNKLRYMYVKKHIRWDGYYYFGLNKSQYEDYLSQKNPRGRKRRHFTFKGTLMLYKIFDECCVAQTNAIAIFRLSMRTDLGFTRLKRDFKTDKAEFLFTRDTPKMTDILQSNYNYVFMKDKYAKHHKRIKEAWEQ